MKKLVAGNWKMNGTQAQAQALVQGVAAGMGGLAQGCDLLVCPPFLYLPAVRSAIEQAGAPIALGAQDCSLHENGAHTGDISVDMLVDAGCGYVIIGHSERREFHRESDHTVAAKAAIAHKKGLITVICVGEREIERSAGVEQDVVANQMAVSLPPSVDARNTVIAYEPVWAIGTGKTATAEDVRAMHRFIRTRLQEKLEDFAQMRILYGGSVKPENARELFAVENVDGALVGGASLKAEQFLAIAGAA